MIGASRWPTTAVHARQTGAASRVAVARDSGGGARASGEGSTTHDRQGQQVGSYGDSGRGQQAARDEGAKATTT